MHFSGQAGGKGRAHRTRSADLEPAQFEGTNSFQYVASFLSKIVHLPVSAETLAAAARNSGEEDTIWVILVDLVLLHLARLPDEPEQRLCRLWDILDSESVASGVCEEGAHNIPNLNDSTNAAATP
jgi:hypothetical protein